MVSVDFIRDGLSPPCRGVSGKYGTVSPGRPLQCTEQVGIKDFSTRSRTICQIVRNRFTKGIKHSPPANSKQAGFFRRCTFTVGLGIRGAAPARIMPFSQAEYRKIGGGQIHCFSASFLTAFTSRQFILASPAPHVREVILGIVHTPGYHHRKLSQRLLHTTMGMITENGGHFSYHPSVHRILHMEHVPRQDDPDMYGLHSCNTIRTV